MTRHLYGDATPGGSWLRRAAAVIAVLAFAGAIAVIAPAGARGVTDLFRVSDGSSATPAAPASPAPVQGGEPAPSAPATTAPMVASEAPVPGQGAAPSTPAPSTPAPPPSTSATTAATTTAAPMVAIETLQTVPAMRDVIVDVDGTSLASDALGRIAVPAELRHGTIEVIGLVADPVLQRVEFARWSDGGTEPRRSLDTMHGPVAQIGLTVRSSVTVQTSTASSLETTVRFVSAAGAIDVPTQTPTWVVATRVVPTPGGLAAEPITYQAAAIVDGERTVALDPQAFFPTPEALWEIQI